MKEPVLNKLFFRLFEHIENIWEQLNRHGNPFPPWQGLLNGVRGATVHPELNVRCPVDVLEHGADVLKLTAFYAAKLLFHSSRSFL